MDAIQFSGQCLNGSVWFTVVCLLTAVLPCSIQGLPCSIMGVKRLSLIDSLSPFPPLPHVHESTVEVCNLWCGRRC